MMGYETWGGGDSVEDYLAGCRASTKYESGDWYVLEADGELVSSLMLFDGGFRLPAGCRGIGSVATRPEFRGRGHASQLVAEAVSLCRQLDVPGVYLHSDIDPDFYARLGFAPVDVPAAKPGSVCMVNVLSADAGLLKQRPDYF
jgi:N-acetylglutamate synthase-like GNAT family acetyltransferase